MVDSWEYCILCIAFWYRVGDSNPTNPLCVKQPLYQIELTRCRAVGPDPGTLRGTHDLESGAGIEPAISWVATRRHTNLTIRSIADRQRIELCPSDLESVGASRTRPIQRGCTEAP